MMYFCMDACFFLEKKNLANSHGGPSTSFFRYDWIVKTLRLDFELCVAFKWQQFGCYLPIMFLLFIDFSLRLLLIFQILYTIQN